MAVVNIHVLAEDTEEYEDPTVVTIDDAIEDYDENDFEEWKPKG